MPDDLQFLKEIREHIEKYKDRRDPTELQYAEQMIADWIKELEGS